MYTNLKQWSAIRHRILVNGEAITSVSRGERISRNMVRKMLKFEKPPRVSKSGQHNPCSTAATVRQAERPAPANHVNTKWNAWLASLEFDKCRSTLPPATERALVSLLNPEPKRQRKKALVVLARDQGFSFRAISSLSGVDRRIVRNYLDAFDKHGIDGLLQRKQRPRLCDDDKLREAIFQMLHEPPALSGVDRSIWRLKDLRVALAAKGISVGPEVIRQVIKAAGYRWRSAKVVLTSTDPEYREKLAHVQAILGALLPTERFFSIDEYGPFAIKMKPGRWLVGPNESPSIPQWQQSKGWLILTAALELSSNQISHFYSTAKNTNEMIRMIGVLVEAYKDAKKLYISWDAASWHMSKALVSFIDDHNDVASENGRPTVELVPLPASAQFLNVIESVFSGMSRAIIHGSNYESKDAAIDAINLYFAQRNENFRANPRRAGNRIWGKERTPSEFSASHNCKDPAYR